MIENNFLTINDFSLESYNYELYMTFTLTEKIYAIPAKKIIEIVRLPALTVLEKLPDYIVGVMNIRGKIISVIDLRKYLGIPQVKYSVDHNVLIINHEDKTVGIIVDSVKDVIQFNKEHLEPLPYNTQEKYISGIYKNEGNLIAFLDLDLVLTSLISIQLDDVEIKHDTIEAHDLFPTDSFSVEKFKKRALNIQKELKMDADRELHQKNNYVSFSLSNETYCISLKHIKVFCKLNMVNLTPVPCVPEFIKGIINLRGEFITIVDIKSFLQIPDSQITEKTKIIVANSPDIKVGLIVDDVFDIINIPSERLTPHTSGKYDKHKYISSEVILDDSTVMSVLELDKFLEDERLYIEDAV